jgi:hypothetical protein
MSPSSAPNMTVMQLECYRNAEDIIISELLSYNDRPGDLAGNRRGMLCFSHGVTAIDSRQTRARSRVSQLFDGVTSAGAKLHNNLRSEYITTNHSHLRGIARGASRKSQRVE